MGEKVVLKTKKSKTKGGNLASLGRKRNLFQPMNSPANHILFLQRTIGNQAVQRLFKSGVIQPKLKINQPGDKYEQEADQVAEQVMSMPEPLSAPITSLVQRQIEEEEEEEEKEEGKIIQTKEVTGRTPEPSSDIASRIQALKGGGQPLPASVRTFFEPRFGCNFSQVQVYNNTQAADAAKSINSRAFTVGKEVVFGAGQYSPETTAGKRLLAHELTHVIQQESQPDLVNKKVLQRQMRRATATDTAPVVTNGIFVVPPATEHARVDAAIAIIERVINNPRDYPRCPTHFRDNCPGGTNTSLQDQYNRAIVWKVENYPDEWLGMSVGTSPNIGYTYHSYRWSHWAIAASLVHEMIHICGVAGHPASALPGYTDICDEAKHWCGRLPNL